ncbi:MAG: Enolase-phosphatase [Vampirovibrio sp.]|jgi:enolase-phosphatase E1|nr:Enolase-phosphatase [Vampirovibrio sp.]
MIRFILLDIEGTTTDIQFVHKVLFPYSAERLADYVAKNIANIEVQSALASVRDTVQTEQGRAISDEEAVETLLQWIQDDRKHTALKQLQGLIWKDGFEQGHYHGHVYPEVPKALEAWKQQGIGLGIYSSGSVQAQKLLFGHSVAGDLTPYFSHYFDTNVGGKKESDSYREIARQLALAPGEILFLSDVEAELDAASEAGLQVTQLLRDGQVAGSKYPAITSFEAIQLPLSASH